VSGAAAHVSFSAKDKLALANGGEDGGGGYQRSYVRYEAET
jgi:hypothetical protein